MICKNIWGNLIIPEGNKPILHLFTILLSFLVVARNLLWFSLVYFLFRFSRSPDFLVRFAFVHFPGKIRWNDTFLKTIWRAEDYLTAISVRNNSSENTICINMSNSAIIWIRKWSKAIPDTNQTKSLQIGRKNQRRMFLCEFCEYVCDRPSHMAIHVRKHTNEKPFECEFCGFACSRKSNFYRHIRLKHGNENS